MSKGLRHAGSDPEYNVLVAKTAFRSAMRPAWKIGDLCRQVSWLTAQASLSYLPDQPKEAISGIAEETHRLQLRGQPWHRCSRIAPRSLFTRRALPPRGTVTFYTTS